MSSNLEPAVDRLRVWTDHNGYVRIGDDRIQPHWILITLTKRRAVELLEELERHLRPACCRHGEAAREVAAGASWTCPLHSYLMP